LGETATLQDANVNQRSILIIDDDEQIRAFLRKVLEEAEYLVAEAPNGQEGIRQFRQTPTLS